MDVRSGLLGVGASTHGVCYAEIKSVEVCIFDRGRWQIMSSKRQEMQIQDLSRFHQYGVLLGQCSHTLLVSSCLGFSWRVSVLIL
jgi:hypothetical protein